MSVVKVTTSGSQNFPLNMSSIDVASAEEPPTPGEERARGGSGQAGDTLREGISSSSLRATRALGTRAVEQVRGRQWRARGAHRRRWPIWFSFFFEKILYRPPNVTKFLYDPLENSSGCISHQFSFSLLSVPLPSTVAVTPVKFGVERQYCPCLARRL